MFRFLRVSLATLVRLFCSRKNLLLENLALRQQLSVLKRRHPRPRLELLDRLFWLIVRRCWSGGAPRIHGELLMLGFKVSERTISRWMKRAPKDPGPRKRWLTFVRNHKEAIAAMDFLTVPTVTFGLLYCFFIISHDRRRILHFSVTKHPTSSWIVQQLREAFPFDSARRFLIFDRDTKYGLEVPVAVRSLGIRPVRTSFESPWQNGVAERWVGSCRREMLDHIIALNERHLKQLLSEYVRYHHEDRTHLGLAKQTPAERIPSVASGRIVSRPRIGGLHHRYDRAASSRLRAAGSCAVHPLYIDVRRMMIRGRENPCVSRAVPAEDLGPSWTTSGSIRYFRPG
jgi:transposase InsO family protein